MVNVLTPVQMAFSVKKVNVTNVVPSVNHVEKTPLIVFYAMKTHYTAEIFSCHGVNVVLVNAYLVNMNLQMLFNYPKRSQINYHLTANQQFTLNVDSVEVNVTLVKVKQTSVQAVTTQNSEKKPLCI